MGEFDFMKHNIHDAVEGVAFLPDGNTLIIGRDKETYFFDIKSGRVNKSIKGLVRDIDLNADGNKLAINHYGALDVYDTASGDSLRSLDLLRVYIGAISISPDGSRVAVGLKNGKALIWGVESGRRDWLYPAE
jgi:WD40 repeat protein